MGVAPQKIVGKSRTRNGDGCSDQCKVEPGFTCAAATTEVDTLNVPIVYRDFRDHESISTIVI
jgi:hypothetical protein